MCRAADCTHEASRNHKGYEEVLVPAVKAGAPAPGEALVRIDELEDWAQLAFEGYKCAPPRPDCAARPDVHPADPVDTVQALHARSRALERVPLY